jgi:hypothetical protein
MSYLNLKTILPAVIVLGGFVICTTASYGTPAIATKTAIKNCGYCHSDVKNAKDTKTLTKPGAYYHEHKTLDGYKADPSDPPKEKK